MTMDFSGSAGAASSFDTLPPDLLLFAVLAVRGVKDSAKGGAYLDCELTIDQGQPYAGRKIFDMIGDPKHPGNSEAYREMGTIAITRILEAGRGAGPNNMAGYQIQGYEQLSGLRVGIKTGVEPGTGGHADKNRVKEWLTPNPASQSGNKGWVRLVAGDHNVPSSVTAQGAPTGFGGFGQAGGVAPAAGGGFGQPAGNAAQSAEIFSQPAGFAAAQPAATSPSDPAATPGWLAQAAR